MPKSQDRICTHCGTEFSARDFGAVIWEKLWKLAVFCLIVGILFDELYKLHGKTYDATNHLVHDVVADPVRFGVSLVIALPVLAAMCWWKIRNSPQGIGSRCRSCGGGSVLAESPLGKEAKARWVEKTRS